jgi:hypothetical protein
MGLLMDSDWIKAFKGLFTPEELKRPSIKRHYDAAIKALEGGEDQVNIDIAMKAAQEIKQSAESTRKKEDTIRKEQIQKHIADIAVDGDNQWDF